MVPLHTANRRVRSEYNLHQFHAIYWISILKSVEVMSDNESPILRRSGRARRQKPPIIQQSSPESPLQTDRKLPVPPTPVPLPAPPCVGARFDEARRLVRTQPHPPISRRQRMLNNRFAAHQAVEGKPGSSVEGSPNSEDDE